MKIIRLILLFMLILLISCGSQSTSNESTDEQPVESAAEQENENEPMNLIDTTWILQSGMVNGDELIPLESNPITLTFEEERVVGNASCNQYFSQYTLSADEFSVAVLATTRMACPKEIMQRETLYMTGLTSAETYQATEEQLTIRLTDGELQFIRDRQE